MGVALVVAWRHQKQLRLAPLVAIARAYGLGIVLVLAVVGMPGDTDGTVYAPQGNQLLDNDYPLRVPGGCGSPLRGRCVHRRRQRAHDRLLMIPFQLQQSPGSGCCGRSGAPGRRQYSPCRRPTFASCTHAPRRRWGRSARARNAVRPPRGLGDDRRNARRRCCCEVVACAGVRGAPGLARGVAPTPGRGSTTPARLQPPFWQSVCRSSSGKRATCLLRTRSSRREASSPSRSRTSRSASWDSRSLGRAGSSRIRR